MQQHFGITGDMQIFKPVFEYQETTRQVPFRDFSFLPALLSNTLESIEIMPLTETTIAEDKRRG